MAAVPASCRHQEARRCRRQSALCLLERGAQTLSGEGPAQSGEPCLRDSSLRLLEPGEGENVGLRGLPCPHARANQRIAVRGQGGSGISAPGFESSSVPSELFTSDLLYPRGDSNIGVMSCEFSRSCYSHSPLNDRAGVWERPFGQGAYARPHGWPARVARCAPGSVARAAAPGRQPARHVTGQNSSGLNQAREKMMHSGDAASLTWHTDGKPLP